MSKTKSTYQLELDIPFNKEKDKSINTHMNVPKDDNQKEPIVIKRQRQAKIFYFQTDHSLNKEISNREF